MSGPSKYSFFAKHVKEILSYTGYTVASTAVGYMTYQVGATVIDTVHKKLDWNNQPPPKPAIQSEFPVEDGMCMTKKNL